MTKQTTHSRVALVTGGSGGIGREVVKRLVADNFAVAVHYASNKEKAETLVADIIVAGGQALVVGGDVADEKVMAQVFDEVEVALGGIDVVINTAGMMLLSTIVDLNLDDLDRMFRTNIRGTFVVAQQAARRVRSGAPLSISQQALHGHNSQRMGAM